MSEVNNVIERYKKRENSTRVQSNENSIYYRTFCKDEREIKYIDIFKEHFGNRKDMTILEVGAGIGDNLLFFHRYGLKWENIYANELLENRFAELQQRLALRSHTFLGDALQLPFKNKFDIVLQSTVFTSLLSDEFKKTFAQKMLEMVKEDGIILWYDFKYNNPKNKDVKGIGRKEVKILFEGAKKITFYNLTLAPPIGRRVKKLYNIINFFFPFLRTHLMAVIQK